MITEVYYDITNGMLSLMKKEDIEHLATLARIRLTEEEKTNFEGDLSSIMDYVSTVSDIVSDDIKTSPEIGAVNNVFRKDEVTNTPDQYTKDVLEEMPSTDGQYLKVKKILQIEE